MLILYKLDFILRLFCATNEVFKIVGQIWGKYFFKKMLMWNQATLVS